MAYSGSKNKHVEILKTANLLSTPIVVDGFFGGGGLSQAYRKAYPAAGKVLIAGESFEPLRRVYKAGNDLEALAKMVLTSFSQIGITETWDQFRDALQGLPSFWESDEAFLILNNLSIGNSMRHGKGRHNVKPCKKKIVGLEKRGRLIDPISVRPDIVYDCWDKAIENSGGQDASFFGDPPYQKCTHTYAKQNWRLCAVPPVALAMSRNYGCIGVFNNFSEDLHAEFQAVALNHGYQCQANPTHWKTCFKPGAKPKGEEWFWVFRP